MLTSWHLGDFCIGITDISYIQDNKLYSHLAELGPIWTNSDQLGPLLIHLDQVGQMGQIRTYLD